MAQKTVGHFEELQNVIHRESHLLHNTVHSVISNLCVYKITNVCINIKSWPRDPPPPLPPESALFMLFCNVDVYM